MLSRLLKHYWHVLMRHGWPGFTLCLLFQRMPLVRAVAELQFALGPRMAQVLKWAVSAGITSSIYNTVTGATGDLSLLGNTTGVVGENMQVAVTAEKAVPVTVQLQGTLPPGMITNIGEGGAVANGTIAFSGIPHTAGEYSVTVTVLTWEENSTYDGDPVFIHVNFEITLEPPEIDDQPSSIVVPWGGTAELSVTVVNEDGVTYQWQRNVGTSLEEFNNIDGAIGSVYSVPGATPDLEGAYRVRVTRNGITITSSVVFLSVRDDPNFASWQQREFEDPESEDADPMANPDGDVFVNAFEFLFDMDPEIPDTVQFPQIGKETINGVDYAVFIFPALIDFPGLDYAFEGAADLAKDSWTELSDGVNGVVIETTALETVLKVPYAGDRFCRVKVNTES